MLIKDSHPLRSNPEGFAVDGKNLGDLRVGVALNGQFDGPDLDVGEAVEGIKVPLGLRRSHSPGGGSGMGSGYSSLLLCGVEDDGSVAIGEFLLCGGEGSRGMFGKKRASPLYSLERG